MEQEVRNYNENMKKQAELCISYGYEIFPLNAKVYLADCINVVEKKMYENKKSKRYS